MYLTGAAHELLPALHREQLMSGGLISEWLITSYKPLTNQLNTLMDVGSAINRVMLLK